MSLGGPLGAEVFTHIQHARHPVALELARESIRQGGTMTFADEARDANLAPGNVTRKIARDEIALVRSHQAVALLFHMERVVRSAGRELDAHVPAPGKIAGGRFRRGRIPCRTL